MEGGADVDTRVVHGADTVILALGEHEALLNHLTETPRTQSEPLLTQVSSPSQSGGKAQDAAGADLTPRSLPGLDLSQVPRLPSSSLAFTPLF